MPIFENRASSKLARPIQFTDLGFARWLHRGFTKTYLVC